MVNTGVLLRYSSPLDVVNAYIVLSAGLLLSKEVRLLDVDGPTMTLSSDALRDLLLVSSRIKSQLIIGILFAE